MSAAPRQTLPAPQPSGKNGRGSVVRTCEICGQRFRIPRHRAQVPTHGRFCTIACTTMARHQGLIQIRRQSWKGRKLKPWTAQDVELLQRRYREDGAAALAEQLGRTSGQVKGQAKKLGLTAGRKDRFWTREDEDWLRDNIARMSWAALAKYLGRTVFAVQLRAKMLGASRVDGSDLWTASQVALIFGVDRSTPTNWIERGWLKGTKVDHIGGAGTWHISPTELLAFVGKHPRRFDIGKVDQISFLDLLLHTPRPSWDRAAGKAGAP